MLRAEGLSKTYDSGVRALDGLSLDVRQGELYTLLGPSGCGKTTALRCVAGLERPDRGEIEVAGRVLSSAERGVWVPPSERGLGFVFQSYALWPHMTVLEHVLFPLSAAPRRRRLSRRERRERAERALELVRLEHLDGRRAAELSGGQQQRLALARALAGEPPLLLLDEPLSSLDASLRGDLRDELKRLQRELGVTVLYVTHDQVEALALSSRVAVVLAGRIEQAGSPVDLYERPSTSFVAEFIGGSNLLAGTVEGRENGFHVVATPQGKLRARVDSALGSGTRVLAVVRAERIQLSPPGTDGGWAGTVESRDFLGESVDHRVRVGDVVLRARSAPGASVEPGSAVELRFDPSATTLVLEDADVAG